MIPADNADLDRYEEEQYRLMLAAREEREAYDAAWNAVWDAERAKRIAQRRYFSLAEIADGLAVDPHTLAVDVALRGRIIADLTDWVKRQQFDLVGGEVVTLCGDPPDFVPLVPLHPGDILVADPEVLMLRHDACRRYVDANAELPGAVGLLHQWFAVPKADCGGSVVGEVTVVSAEPHSTPDGCGAPEVADPGDRRKIRGAYKGALNEWLAPQKLDTLKRQELQAIARSFRDHVQHNRPEIVLPGRLRSVEPEIERHIRFREHRLSAAKSQ